MSSPVSDPSSPRRFAIGTLGSILGLLFGLLFAEIAVRGSAWVGIGAGRRVASRDPLATVYLPYGRSAYRPRPGMIERYPNGTAAHFNSMGFRGPAVSLQKPAGTYRILLLGGSTAAGYGANDDATIDAHLRRLLTARYPGRCFEVVNLALGGYDSYQEYERMRVDGTRLSPDLVVVHSGINDVRNAQYADLASPPDPRTLIWESALEELRGDAGGGTGLWARVKHYSYLARLPGYVIELRRQHQTLGVTLAAAVHDAALSYFETNVMRTIDVAAGSGAAIILSTPPSALNERNRPTDPVEKSYWIRDAGTTEAYRRRLGAKMQEIAGREREAGRRVSYVSYQVPLPEFLDDAHLLGAGNESVARGLVDAAEPYVRAALPHTSTTDAGCRQL